MSNTVDFNRKRADKMLRENDALGGSVVIKYDEYAVVAPCQHVYQTYDILLGKNRAQRRDALKGVNKSIKTLLPLAAAGEATNQEAMFLAQDITIWFANECVVGRKSFDDMKKYVEGEAL